MSSQTKQTLRHDVVVFIIALIVAYLFNSQYSADQRFTRFFLNKTVANLAVVLIGISYLLGPLCIFIPKLARHLSFRRYFGVAGFLAVIAHIILSVLQWNTRFTFSWYVDHKYGVTAAVGATLIFTALALTSHNRLIKDLGSKRWKWLQRMGYIAVMLALIHIYIASSPRWFQWFDGKVAMPNSFVTFVVGCTVVFTRLLALLHTLYLIEKKNRLIGQPIFLYV